MRVFVVGTGRCGTVTFSVACCAITNYATGHETYNPKLVYSDNWIEVSSQIRHCITELFQKYPDSKWVHLKRERTSCIKSIGELDGGFIVAQYYKLHPTVCKSDHPIDIASRFYDSQIQVIDAQLNHIPESQRIEVWLESMKSGDWLRFWEWIEAEGDYQASLAAWDKRHNSTATRRRRK